MQTTKTAWEWIQEFVDKFYWDTPQGNHLGQSAELAIVDHLHEELEEYEKAVVKMDAEAQFDGLLDIIWIAMKALAIKRMPFPEGFRRVAIANLAKERVPASATGRVTIIDTRGSGHDLRKPNGWQEPRFKDLLEK